MSFYFCSVRYKCNVIKWNRELWTFFNNLFVKYISKCNVCFYVNESKQIPKKNSISTHQNRQYTQLIVGSCLTCLPYRYKLRLSVNHFSVHLSLSQTIEFFYDNFFYHCILESWNTHMVYSIEFKHINDKKDIIPFSFAEKNVNNSHCLCYRNFIWIYYSVDEFLSVRVLYSSVR